MSDEECMQLAIEKAREGIKNGQTPFGAVIVKNGEIVSAVHNVVWETTDITAHAEVHAIRDACKKLGTVDLSGCTIYSTCEPCPMCFSAIHWAKIDRIVFGARIEDAGNAGFNELSISNEEMKEKGQSPVNIEAEFMRDANKKVFQEFIQSAERRTY